VHKTKRKKILFFSFPKALGHLTKNIIDNCILVDREKEFILSFMLVWHCICYYFSNYFLLEKYQINILLSIFLMC